MAKDIVGTPVKVMLGGVAYRVAADASPEDLKPRYKNEAEHSTGGSFRKMVDQSQEVKSFPLKVNADEAEQIKAHAESPEDITLAYENRDGSVYRAVGWIDYEGRDSSTGKLEITMYPRNGWTSFVAK